MVTLTCKLLFPDGKVVTGKMTAESPEGRNPVQYDGPVERLSETFDDTTVASLIFLFRDLARETGAAFSSDMEGEFDQWAE